MPLAMPCRTILEETLVSENSLGENKPVGRVQGRSKCVVSNDRLVSIADGECKKTMQKGVGLQEKNLTYSDFFYFYNSSNSISLSVSGFKVTADGIFR